MIICPLCKSEENTFSEDRITCKSCGEVFPVTSGIPCFAPDIMHNNEFFNAHIFPLFERAAYKHFWFLGRKHLIYNFAKRYLLQDIKMLEIGSGVADISRYFSQKHINIETSDVFFNVTEMAKDKYGFKSYQLDAAHLPFKNHYDIIGIFDVLEHITDEDTVLENIHCALKEKGVLIITVPAFQFLWSYWDDVNKHKRRYTKKTLKEKLEHTGFFVERISYIFFLLSPFVFGKRLLTRFLGEIQSQEALFEKELRIVPVINSLFYYLVKLESFIIKYGNFPFGSSLIAVAKKK